MKKVFKTLLFMIFSIFMSTTFTSCGDDDEKANSAIVGEWKCDDHYYGGSDYYTFNSNGSYSWECPGSWHPSHSGYYSYVSNSGLLTLSKNSGSSLLYLAHFSNHDVLILTDEDGDSYTYRRQ